MLWLAIPHDLEEKADLTLVASGMPNYSIGSVDATRVVVRPGVRSAISDDPLKTALRGLREQCTTLIGDLRVRILFIDGYGLAGIELEEGSAGRLQVPADD